MTLKSHYQLQARISALEALVLELLSSNPNASAISEALEASLANQHALQISNGTDAEFVSAFRSANTQLLLDVHQRLRG